MDKDVCEIILNFKSLNGIKYKFIYAAMIKVFVGYLINNVANNSLIIK